MPLMPTIHRNASPRSYVGRIPGLRRNINLVPTALSTAKRDCFRSSDTKEVAPSEPSSTRKLFLGPCTAPGTGTVSEAGMSSGMCASMSRRPNDGQRQQQL
jgi:hypothetical protein